MKLTAEEITELKVAFQTIWNAVPMSARTRVAEHYRRMMDHLVDVQTEPTKPNGEEIQQPSITKKGK
jgi:hypothetical protein